MSLLKYFDHFIFSYIATGQEWLKENSNKMLDFRCEMINETFDQPF